MVLKIKNFVLLIALSFALANCATVNSKVVGSTVRIENIEVAQSDFEKKMDWRSAKAACEKLGDGWRLPTMDELKLIDVSRDSVQGIKLDIYWSSEDFTFDTAWYYEFAAVGEYGKPRFAEQYKYYLVRPVRTVP